MIQISLTKIYGFFVALMLLIPITSFNTNTEGALKKESEISKKIKIEKMKIDLQLRASYAEGLNNTY